MKMKFIFIGLIWTLHSIAQYPPGVQSALLQTKTNKQQLKTALDFFYKTNDTLKIKAINFLVANMPIHKSVSYYWGDSANKYIEYNELDYSSFTEAVAAFEKIKEKNGKLHPIIYSYKDIDSIKANLLIENVNLSVLKYRERIKTTLQTEQDFLEYILPYRTSIEPLQNWRKLYSEKFEKIIDNKGSIDTQLLQLGQNIKAWFLNTYNIESRKEPLPRLGAMQLLSRAKGPCEDIADLSAFMLRSQGIVATCDIVTFWGTSSGKHFCNGTYNSIGEPIRFDASTGNVRFEKFDREPAKIIRTTFSNRLECIANILTDKDIPEGFMRLKNYIDVTPLYWPTDSFSINQYPQFANEKIFFASVFNFGNWHPTWWAKKNAGSFTFTNMSKGVVYLPTVYKNKKNIPAGWPVALGYNNKIVLKTDTLHTITLIIPEKEKYLKYRGNQRYTLYYWNNQWVKHSAQIATYETHELKFENLPSNALYLLLPVYSQGKDRPFLIDSKGGVQYF